MTDPLASDANDQYTRCASNESKLETRIFVVEIQWVDTGSGGIAGRADTPAAERQEAARQLGRQVV